MEVKELASKKIINKNEKIIKIDEKRQLIIKIIIFNNKLTNPKQNNLI